MIWSLLFLSFGLASAVENVHPKYLDELRESGQDEKFAELLGIRKDLVRPNDEQRSEGSIYNNASFLGDMLLSEEQERQVTNFRKWPTYKWPNGEVPYYVAGDYNSNERWVIEDAIGYFNIRVNKIRLIPWNGHRDYVYVFAGSGCWSYVGKIGGGQGLSLQRNGCVWRSTVQHEFGHAIGFMHEQNRDDRDSYVTVLWDNIPDNWKSQYQKVNPDDYPNIGGYDHYSIMHYGMTAPGTNKDAFAIPNWVDRNRVGRSDSVTDADVRKINKAYE